MKIDVLTLFPEMLDTVFNSSILGRAQNAGLIDINCINIRDFAFNKHKKVDDTPYGGGRGMVMEPEPIYQAFLSCLKDGKKPKTIYMSPKGTTFNQKKAKELSKEEHLIFLCGHYEGVDQRVIDEIVDEELSVGDYVLTGGELAAAVVIDAVARMIEGVLSNEECFIEESHYNGLLEYPQYTRPYDWHGKTIPDVLISGHHENIEKWRREQSLSITLKQRPDLLKKADLSENEKEFIKKQG